MAVKKRLPAKLVKSLIEPVFEEHADTKGHSSLRVSSITYYIGRLRRNAAESRGEDVSALGVDDFSPSENTVRNVLREMKKEGSVSDDWRKRNTGYSYTSEAAKDEEKKAKDAVATQEILARRLTEVLGLPFDPRAYRSVGAYESDGGGTVAVSLADLARMADLVDHYVNDADDEGTEEKSVGEYDALEDRH